MKSALGPSDFRRSKVKHIQSSIYGQALGRNAPCKVAVRRAQLELGMDVSASTAAFCKARGRVLPSTLEGMSARLSAEADALCGLDEFTGVWALDGTTFYMSKPPAGSRRASCTSETGLSARSRPSRSLLRRARTGYSGERTGAARGTRAT